MFDLSKQFRFEAAHTLHREVDAEPSRRIHGLSYRAEVTVRGLVGPVTGIVVDLGQFERALETERGALDHRFLDGINDLGPAKLENLSVWILHRTAPVCCGLANESVYRDSSGDTRSYSWATTGAKING
ncbi:6-pyruvoyl trahydropterin synthase family protein [Prosthecomicrobium sp. N25]|uniref:6-pyruvoyl trahydropterin synthase family protein n=1 Tax=Prosthecomicrobium sp. N25 TaxID=3129254 RepID=UPI0030780A5A